MNARIAAGLLLLLSLPAYAQTVLPPSSNFGNGWQDPATQEWMKNIGKQQFDPKNFPQPVIPVTKGMSNGLWIWLAVSAAAGIAVIGGIVLRFFARGGNSRPMEDPWIKAKIAGGATPGTLTPMDPIPIPEDSLVARAMSRPAPLEGPPMDKDGFTFNYARKVRGM